jgi:hypothetical protein
MCVALLLLRTLGAGDGCRFRSVMPETSVSAFHTCVFSHYVKVEGAIKNAYTR